MTRIDFEVLTAAGAVICTFADRQMAVTHARAAAAQYPGLRVVMVQRSVQQVTVWTEAKLQLVGSGR